MAGGEDAAPALTSNQPKPMVPIVGKPCIGTSLSCCAATASTRSSSRSRSCRRRSAATSATASRSARRDRYSVEELPLGTAARCGSRREKLDETFLVISGDALAIDLDLGALVDRHKETGAAVTIEAQGGRQPARVRDRRHRRRRQVGRFLEKPSWARSSPTRSTRASVARAGGAEPRFSCGPGRSTSPRRLFPLLLEMGRPIYGHVMEGYWQDVASLDQCGDELRRARRRCA